jgi:hypothetical protein
MNTDFHSFSQVTAIPTPAASPTKQRRRSDNSDDDQDDTASIGPRSIIDIQFLSTTAAAAAEEIDSQTQRPRLYSLHNPDQLLTSQEEDSTDSAIQPSPSPVLASPTFSDATLSTLEGDATPSARESLVAMSYVDVGSDENETIQLRQGHASDPSQQQSYRLPDGSEWPCQKPQSTAALAMTGEARERSRPEVIHNELGYLGDSIH